MDGGGEGRLPNKGRYGCAGPGIRLWEVNFARALGFWQFLTKMCNV